MLEKLKKLLLYAGAEPEDFARCQMDVQIANRRRLTAFLGTACAFFVALTLGSCMVPLLYDHIPVFAAALIVSLGLLAVEQMFPQKLGLFLNWEIYAFGAMIYGLGIYLGTVQTPDQRAAAFFAGRISFYRLSIIRRAQGEYAAKVNALDRRAGCSCAGGDNQLVIVVLLTAASFKV